MLLHMTFKVFNKIIVRNWSFNYPDDNSITGVRKSLYHGVARNLFVVKMNLYDRIIILKNNFSAYCTDPNMLIR